MRNFRGRIFIGFLLLIVLFALNQPAEGDGEKIEIDPPELVCYRCRLKDRPAVLWEGRRLTEQIASAPDRYAIRYLEEGVFGEEKRRERRSVETEFDLSGGCLKILRSRSTARDGKGRVVNSLSVEFDYPDREVRTRQVIGPDARAETDDFDLKTPMITAREIWLFLRGFPYPETEGHAADLEFEILTAEPASYSLRLRHEGNEDVVTPAGTFPCHRLRMVPDLGFLSWVGEIFAPDIFLWFTEEPPHHWVRYSGPESGPGTPEVVVEMVEASRGSPLEVTLNLNATSAPPVPIPLFYPSPPSSP